MDNGEASFIVGEEVPVITGSAAGSNNENPFQTVDRKEVGIKRRSYLKSTRGTQFSLRLSRKSQTYLVLMVLSMYVLLNASSTHQ